MPDMSAPLKLGADCWNSYTDWPSWLAAMQRAERLGYDSLWAPDHLYPPNGDPDGPCLEPYMLMAPIAAMTTRPTVGLMVGANTYRNPALVAKMVTTLDHISGGRAILAIGAAWNEIEHTGFGFEYGASPGERLRWLAEALPVIRGMLDGSGPRRRVRTTHARRPQRAAAPPAPHAHPHRRQRPQRHAPPGRRVGRHLQHRGRPRRSARRTAGSSSTATRSVATSVRSSGASTSACPPSATRALTPSA